MPHAAIFLPSLRERPGVPPHRLVKQLVLARQRQLVELAVPVGAKCTGDTDGDRDPLTNSMRNVTPSTDMDAIPMV